MKPEIAKFFIKDVAVYICLYLDIIAVKNKRISME